MNRHHLIELDRALLRLVEERARLVRAADNTIDSAPAIADLLRRSTGDVAGPALQTLLVAVDAACAPTRGEVTP